MKEIFNKTIVALVLSVFLLGSGGFPVYEHFCGCEHSSYSSLFIEDFDCHDQPHPEPATATLCCSATNGNHQQEEGCSTDHDCCHTSSFFMKIDDVFILSLKKAKDPLPAETVAVLIENYDIPVAETSPHGNLRPDPRHQSPPSGKDRLITLHQLKIPTLPLA